MINSVLLLLRTTTLLTSVISALMRVRRSPHDATPPLLSVHCHPWPQPHILHIAIQPCSPSHPWPAPTSAARHFQVPASAHLIIHLLPLDMLEPPQSTPSHNLHHTINSESSPSFYRGDLIPQCPIIRLPYLSPLNLHNNSNNGFNVRLVVEILIRLKESTLFGYGVAYRWSLLKMQKLPTWIIYRPT